ncbi:hypothetical protein BGZ83_000795 [Gryganskiella cystojenkinii]|nr:hypothetical protein BGZ83_000795 [Gryganskiella cystojenkinii]
MAASLLPMISEESTVGQSSSITIRQCLASAKNKVRRSFTLSTKLALGLLVTVMLLLIVQERHDVSFDFRNITPSPASTKTPVIDTALNNNNIRESSKPLIYDIILLNSELNLLEIRLNELHEHVDWFVIIEAEQTFTGFAKPLNFRLNEPRFEKFRRQILHIVIPANAYDAQSNGWGREALTRNLGFWKTLDTHRPRDGDWLMISDLDEVPRRSVLTEMKEQNPKTKNGRFFGDGIKGSGGDLFRLGCHFYYYSYEYRHIRGLWNGPMITRYRSSDYWLQDAQSSHPQAETMRDLSREDWREAGEGMRNLRNSDKASYVDDACYHCTWCFPNITQIVSKVEAYSHQEHNHPQYKTRKWILDAVKEGRDLFERDYDQFEYVKNNKDVPIYVAQNREKYSYMLQRHNLPNAGFLDVNPEDPLDETWKPAPL